MRGMRRGLLRRRPFKYYGVPFGVQAVPMYHLSIERATLHLLNMSRI